jgi:hypothetical protein
VGNFGTRSFFISRRTFNDDNFGIRWPMDSLDEQNFTLLPSDVVILDPVQKREQFNFL